MADESFTKAELVAALATLRQASVKPDAEGRLHFWFFDSPESLAACEGELAAANMPRPAGAVFVVRPRVPG